MALFDLVLAWCFLAPVVATFATARGFSSGLTGYAIALVVGVGGGGLSAWTVRAVGKRVVAGFGVSSEGRAEWSARGLYAGAILWIVLSTVLLSWVTTISLEFAR